MIVLIVNIVPVLAKCDFYMKLHYILLCGSAVYQSLYNDASSIAEKG